MFARGLIMNDTEIEKFIPSAANGDEITREKLIRHYQPYILNVVGHLCQKYITWSDEEASIGLIALNRSIDTFNPEAGKTFLNYVYLLIKRDLIDYFRREKKELHLHMEMYSNEDESLFNLYEIQNSVDSYHQTVQEYELVEEILELNEALSLFEVAFEELEHFSPKHRDTRDNLFEMANSFIQYSDLVEIFNKKKRLPASAFVKKSGYHLKTIEKHRKYLITLIIVKLHPEWSQLSEYIQSPPESEGKS